MADNLILDIYLEYPCRNKEDQHPNCNHEERQLNRNPRPNRLQKTVPRPFNGQICDQVIFINNKLS